MSEKKVAPPLPTVRQNLAIIVFHTLEEMTVDAREGAGGAMKPLAAFIAWRYRDDDSMSPENALEALERTRLISFSQIDHAYHVREAWLKIPTRLQGSPVPGARILTPERIKRLYAWQRVGCQSFTDAQADTDPPEGWKAPSRPEALKEAKKSLPPPPPPPLEEPEIDLFPIASDLLAASRLLRAARRPFDMKSFRLILLAHSKGNEAEADKLQQALVKKGCYQSDGRGIISLVQRVVASFTHGRALVWSSDEELREILEIQPEVRPAPPPPKPTAPAPEPKVQAPEPSVPDELNERFRMISGTLAKNILMLEENLPGSCVPEYIFLYVAKPIAGGTLEQAHKLLGEYLALGFLVQSQQDGTLVLSRDGRTWAEAQKMRPNVNIEFLRKLYPKVFSVEIREPAPPVEAVVSTPDEEIKELEAEAAVPNPPEASLEASGKEAPPNTDPDTFYTAPFKSLRVAALLNLVQERWGDDPMPTRLTDMVAERASWDRRDWYVTRANAGSTDSNLLTPTKGKDGRSTAFWKVTLRAKTIVEEHRYDPSLSADDVDTVIVAYCKEAGIPVPTAVAEVQMSEATEAALPQPKAVPASEESATTPQDEPAEPLTPPEAEEPAQAAEVAAKTGGRKRTDPRDPAKGHTYCRIIYIHLRVEEMLGRPVSSTLSNELLDTIVRYPQPDRTNMKTDGLLHAVSSFRNARNRTEILWRVTDAGRQFLLDHPLQAPPLSDEEIRKRIETWKAKNTPAVPAPNASEPPPHVEAPVSEPVAPSVMVVAEENLPDPAAVTPSEPAADPPPDAATPLPSVETNDGEEGVEEAPLPLSPLLEPTLPTEENARAAANLDNIRERCEKEIAELEARLSQLRMDSQSLAEAATRLDGKPRK